MERRGFVKFLVHSTVLFLTSLLKKFQKNTTTLLDFNSSFDPRISKYFTNITKVSDVGFDFQLSGQQIGMKNRHLCACACVHTCMRACVCARTQMHASVCVQMRMGAYAHN